MEDAYPDLDSDDEEFIKRPEAEELFEGVVGSSPSEYSVITGSHGTGKSTLARKVARKTQGVIYVNVPSSVKPGDKCPVEDGLDTALREALNWHKPIPPWFFVLFSKLFPIAETLLQPGKRVLIIVFIVPRTDRFLPRRVTGKQWNLPDIGGFRASCRPLQGQV